MKKDSRIRFFEKNVYFFKRVKNNRECLRTFFQVPPTGPGLQRQPSVGNVLARASSFSTTGGPLLPRQISAVTGHHHEASMTVQLQRQTSAGSPKQNDNSTVQRQNSGGSSTSTNTTSTGNGVLRQGSQGSLFEQIASQAKDLVRETTRQSSQDGLLAHMDKVFTRKACDDDDDISWCNGIAICVYFLEFYQTDNCIIVWFFSWCCLFIRFIFHRSSLIKQKKKLQRQARIACSHHWSKYVFLTLYTTLTKLIYS